MNCTATGPTGYATWPGANYVIWMGGTFNKNGGSDSTLRAHHMQHYLIQHTRWINAPRGREHWQFRAYDEFANFTPAEEANRFVLLSDNVVENPGSNGFFSVRVCVDSGCNCGEGAPQCGGAEIAERGARQKMESFMSRLAVLIPLALVGCADTGDPCAELSAKLAACFLRDRQGHGLAD